MKCIRKNKYCQRQVITKDITNNNYFCSGHNSNPQYKRDTIKLCYKSKVAKGSSEMTPKEALAISLLLLTAVFNLDCNFKEK